MILTNILFVRDLNIIGRKYTIIKSYIPIRIILHCTGYNLNSFTYIIL